MKSRVAALVLFVAASLFCAPVASADIIFTFSGGTQQMGQVGTYGFRFTPVVNIFVDSLGFFDAGSNGLSAGHAVGIWNLSGTLLRTTTVTTGNSTLSGPIINGGQYRFTPVFPATQLIAGTTYVFGASEAGASDIWWAGGTNISNSPSLALVSSTGFYNVSGGLSFPDSTINNKYAAGSFTAYAIPEPSTLALAAVGAIGLLFTSRRPSSRPSRAKTVGLLDYVVCG